jgi:hypothetical protein
VLSGKCVEVKEEKRRDGKVKEKMAKTKNMSLLV